MQSAKMPGFDTKAKSYLQIKSLSLQRIASMISRVTTKKLLHSDVTHTAIYCLDMAFTCVH